MNNFHKALLTGILIFTVIDSSTAASNDSSDISENGSLENITESSEVYPILPDYIMEKKREGWYTGVLPIYNYTSENGHGYGVRAALFQNGGKDEKFFDRAPYKYRITTQAYAATLGWQYHFIDADMPFFQGTLFRVKTGFVYDKTTNAGYFGNGPEETDLLTDSSGKTYSTYEEYQQKFITSPADNPVNYKYDKYGITRPRVYINCYRNITRRFKVMSGLELKHTRVDPWGGRKFDIEDDEYNVDAKAVIADTTRIESDNLDNQDGWLNSITIGAGYDTRDYEPDPRSGMFIDYTFSFSLKLIGSGFDCTRSTAAARYFFTPEYFTLNAAGSHFRFIPTLAFRGAYTTTTGDTPFHQLGIFNYMYDSQKALGSNRTIRGYRANRFIGHTMTNANIELRMEFLQFTVMKNLFSIKALAFADTGSVFNDALTPLTDFDYYHNAFGGGLALAWNQSLIIHFYYGWSPEDSAISMDIGHAI